MGDADDEIKAIRTDTVMFDMSPVVKYRIKGPEAEAFLNKLTTRQMAIKPGRVRYTCWCNHEGKLLDDGTAFRISEDEYLLCPGERHPEHFPDVAKGMNVEVKEVTGEIASLTIQGKTSLSTLQEIGIKGLEKMLEISELERWDYDMSRAVYGGGGAALGHTAFQESMDVAKHRYAVCNGNLQGRR